MTDDGQWSHRITSPRHHCEKTYLVTLESPVADDAAGNLLKACSCASEKITKPAVLEVMPPAGSFDHRRRALSSGETCAAVGNHVVELHRERIGITLDADLAPVNIVR